VDDDTESDTLESLSRSTDNAAVFWSVCVYVCMRVCVYIYICIYIIFINIYRERVYVCACVCVYIYI
jgi:hypothetical protein